MSKYINTDGIRSLFDEEYKRTRKLIEQGETHLDNLAEGFLEAEQVISRMTPADVKMTDWIPCSERLPSETTRALVTRFDDVTETPFIDILWFENGVWWNRLYPGDYRVIAWMPLPKPYSEPEKKR